MHFEQFVPYICKRHNSIAIIMRHIGITLIRCCIANVPMLVVTTGVIRRPKLLIPLTFVCTRSNQLVLQNRRNLQQQQCFLSVFDRRHTIPAHKRASRPSYIYALYVPCQWPDFGMLPKYELRVQFNKNWLQHFWTA